MTHLEMLTSLAEANRNHDWTEAARLRTVVTTPTPCGTPTQAAYMARTAAKDAAQALQTPKKEALYRTAIVAAADLPGIAQGEVVGIVKWHDYNGTYTVRSISGVLQCMVPATSLDHFVL